MQEPERLLEGGATDFERTLLDAVKDERPSAELQQRMQQALGLPSGTAAVPPTAGAALGSGLQAGAFKVLLGLVVAGGVAYSVVSLTTAGGDQGVSAPAKVTRPPVAAVAAPQRASVPPRDEASEADVLPGQATADEVPWVGADGESTSGEEEDERRAPAAADSLRLEIELLDAVRSASLLGESERAEKVLERYDQRFPRGVLQREADLLRRSGKATGATPSAPSRGADPEAASGR